MLEIRDTARDNRLGTTLVWLVYFGIGEALSLGQTSKVSPCIIISQKQNAYDQSNYQSCAPMHEAIFRLLNFIWDNATHDNIGAAATVMIALFTLTLWWSTSGLLKTTNESIRLAREAFIAANRPKLIVRGIVVYQLSTFESTFSGDFEGFKDGEKLDGHVFVINIGGTSATIEFFDRIVYWTQGRLPMRRPYEGRVVERLDRFGPPIGPIVIPAGGGCQMASISCAKPMGPEARDVTTRQNNWRLYVMGWIRYRDERGVHTHMRFCQEWHYPDERFRAVSDDHYESECY